MQGSVTPCTRADRRVAGRRSGICGRCICGRVSSVMRRKRYPKYRSFLNERMLEHAWGWLKDRATSEDYKAAQPLDAAAGCSEQRTEPQPTAALGTVILESY